jgi:hypothetical protein
MNLKKALKEKNKLKGKISDSFDKLRRYNLTTEGTEKTYSTHELYQTTLQDLEAIVALKTKIQLANGPILNKIFRLSELKNLASKMKYWDCDNERTIDSGIISFSYPEITVLERDQLLEGIENEIESIQDELDSFNQKTNI